jgi:PAS domain S-box-containing protein
MEVSMSEQRIYSRAAPVGGGLPAHDGRGPDGADLLNDPEFVWSVLAHSTEAIVVLDLDARIQFVSPAALRALQITDADALIGTPWLAFWHDDGSAQALACIEAAKAGRTASFEASRCTAEDRRSRWHVTVAPIRGGGGKPSRLLTIARDGIDRLIADRGPLATPRELHHRVKNTLAMAMAITSQSLARAATLAEGRQVVEERLMALAGFHDVLHEGGEDGASLREVVERAVAPYDSSPSPYAITGDDIALSPRAALAAGMALHELCTNAVRHGVLSAKGGAVDISWRTDEAARRLHLTWRERSHPEEREPLRPGFGMRIIQASFRDQLGGSVALSLEPEGLVCAFEAPLSALQETARKRAAD